MLLAGTNFDGDRQALAVTDQVDFGAETTLAAAQGMVSRLAGRPFFSSPGRGLVGADDGAVDEEQVPVDASIGLALHLQMFQDPLPEASAGPTAEAAVDGLPGTEAFGQVAPGGPGGLVPEDAVEQQ